MAVVQDRSQEEIPGEEDFVPAAEGRALLTIKALAVCAFLLLAVGFVFGQTLQYEFVNYDDPEYIYKSPQVVRGLTLEGIRWAFTSPHSGNWDPLTWISHMLDYQLYGLDAGGHHLTSVLLHGATAILLFLILLRMTGSFWPSALAAVVWAIHPLRVESVAWAAERKDVLSGLFFMLTLGAYVEYVRHPFSLARYLAVLVAFALGLMSKPMLVTLPCVLLLLDYWPLGRMVPLAAEDSRISSARVWRVSSFSFPMRLLVEKLPLLAFVATSCGLTLWAQREAGGMRLNESLPLLWRLGNAVVSYVAYLGQLVFPVDLAVFYPHPGLDLPAWKIVSASLVLIGISVGTLAARRKHPYLLVGWLWYLGMLLPVSGLLQTGSHAKADRFTYLPQVGLLIALVWGGAHLYRSWPRWRLGYGVASALIIIALMGCAWRQTSVWQNSETLWTHALACTSRNAVALHHFGVIMGDQGKIDEAIRYYRKALEIKPAYIEAHNNLGILLAGRGQVDEAIAHYEMAVKLKTKYAEVHNNLAFALGLQGRVDEAISHYQKAIEINPEYVGAQYNLGKSLVRRGRVDEAIKHYQKALELNPNYAEAYGDLGLTLAAGGRVDEAITHYRKALRINPNSVEAHNNLGVAFVSRGRLDEAIQQYRLALELDPKIAEIHNNLGKVLAARGQIDEAIKHYQKALKLNPDYAQAHWNLGNVLASRGRVDEAVRQYQTALKLKPDFLEACNNFAWLLATWPEASFRDGDKAVELAERALELSGGGEPGVLDTLAAAYAEAGRFPEAAEVVRNALELAGQQGKQALVDSLQAKLALYESGTAFQQEAAAE